MLALPTEKLRGLSLWNPWAWAIFRAGKDVENRGVQMRFRGWVAIQVSKHWDLEEVEQMIWAVKDAANITGFSLPAIDLHEMHQQRGHIIGMAYIDDWKPALMYSSPWASKDGYGAHVSKTVEIKKVECRGMPGLFDLPETVERQVRREFESSARIMTGE